MIKTDGIFRMISVNVRRYSREPDERVSAARQMLAAAVALYAEHTSPADAALATSETIAALAAAERVQRRRVG